jgi:YafQ family addiction module toxin component
MGSKYSLEIRKSADKQLRKQTPDILRQINKKINEIIENPQRYKNLRSPLNHWKRVHIGKSFVLCYSVNELNKAVIIEAFDHHDKIYLTKRKRL